MNKPNTRRLAKKRRVMVTYSIAPETRTLPDNAERVTGLKPGRYIDRSVRMQTELDGVIAKTFGEAFLRANRTRVADSYGSATR